MSPRETIAFLLTAPSKSQAVNGFVGLAGAQMGLKYGFMSLFCIVKGQQEQEIIAELLIYDGRRPLPLLLNLCPHCWMLPGCRDAGNAVEPCLSFPRAAIPWGWASHWGYSQHARIPFRGGDPWGRPSAPRAGCPGAMRAVRAAWAGPGGPPQAALSCFANPAWHLPQLPAASREQRNQLILPALGEVGQARQALPLTRGEARRGPAGCWVAGAGWLGRCPASRLPRGGKWVN